MADEQDDIPKLLKAGEAVVTAKPDGGTDLVQAGAQLEARIKLVERVHALIQSRINPNTDICKIGGKVRRTINFARKVRRIVGGTLSWWHDPETDLPYKKQTYSDAGGPYYTYTVGCKWVLPWGETYEASYMISSREPFLGIEDEALKPLEKVQESDVLEMAASQALKSCVFSALGFSKDIEPDELTKYGVAAPPADRTHDFTKGKRTGVSDSNDEQTVRGEIVLLCRKLLDAVDVKFASGQIARTAEEVLQAITENPPKKWEGWRSFRAIKASQLVAIHDQLQKRVAAVGGETPQSELDGVMTPPDGKEGQG